MAFLACCENCQRKASAPKKGLVVKPILSNDMNSRCQVDLIDMQSSPDGEFKFIMVYQDHLTKFIQLRPLKTKSAEEVAVAISSIFAIFGAPSILHTDNGKEFANKVITELCSLWSGTKIVRGKPRHSQSQGSVERANQDVEKLIYSWQTDNRTAEWMKGLDLVQFQKNRSFHSGIKTSPYQAMFGIAPKMGIESIPSQDLDNVETEEEFESLISNMQSGTMNTLDKADGAGEEGNNDMPDNVQMAEEVTDPIPMDTDSTENVEPATSNFNLEKKLEGINNSRMNARDGLRKQAEKMKQISESKFPPGKVGQTVRIKIPEVDKSKVDGHNLIGIILEIVDETFYKIGTRSGILRSLYSRNQFTICKEEFLKADDVPVTQVSLRGAASSVSQVGGQGYFKCMCSTKCTDKRCKCRKSGRLCNSKCHNSNSCCNK